MQNSKLSTKVDFSAKLLDKINTKAASLGVIGVGYVGRPLAEAASDEGYRAIGFDLDVSKIEALNNQNKNLLSATENFDLLSTCDVVCICVPTPIDSNNSPDLSLLERAAGDISARLRPGQLVILESSVAPGTTRDYLLPILKRSNLREGVDFFLAFSPERIDPGNSEFTLLNTPKVVGGFDEQSVIMAMNFYQNFIQKVIPVSSLEVAEMSKMLENTFRFVNINLINELSDYASLKGINMWEVIDAAATKPFAFLPHYPSAGIGGHCIPVDPYYLIHDANKAGRPLKILGQVADYHEQRAAKIVDKALELLTPKSNENARLPSFDGEATSGQGNGYHKGPVKILLLGIAYKSGTGDTRESPALKIWKIAENKGAQVSYHDPHVPKLNGWNSKELTAKILQEYDLIIVTTDHPGVPYDLILQSGKPVLDTKNVFKNASSELIFRI